MHAVLMSEVTRWNSKVFIGEWTNGAGGSQDVIEKATGNVLAQTGIATPDDVTRAARIAKAAQPAWAAVPIEEKSAIFRRAINLIEQHRTELIEWIMRESGGLRAKGEGELRSSINCLNYAAAMLTEPPGIVLPSNPGRLSYARRMPHGVVGIISPFNFPLILSMRAIAPALATGNAVIVKPDHQTAICGGLMIARLFEEAGLPPGVLHILPGDAQAGAAVCTDPLISMVAFTGSTAAGRKVAATCGEHLKKVSLELGGKNTLMILEDVDLDLAASNAAFAAWLHQGQVCMASGRILVQRKIVPALVERLKKKAQHLRVGDPMNPEVGMGPIINHRQLQQIHQIVQDTVAAGATLHAGGTHEGLFYQPTVLSGVAAGMSAFDKEIFGPVAAITAFDTDEEAVAMANQTEYGLSAGILSKSIGRAMAIGNQLQTGLVHINDQTIHSDATVPYGGRGASGNGSRIGGPANWEEFTQWQWITIKDTPLRFPY